MAHVSDLIARDIGLYLKSHEHKSLLRFITCGSVDDGKSTLIGRLLYESKLLYEDQLAALAADSKKVGTQGGALDFALLLDGLTAERQQGITIDVAYRFFSTDKRKFIVADTPGHEQYTRNMVTGASTADVAVILIDARKGVLTQTTTAQLSSLADRHSQGRAGDQQAGPGRLCRRGGRAHRGRIPGVWPENRAPGHRLHPAVSPARRQRHRNQCEHALVSRPDVAELPGNGGSQQRRAKRTVPAARAVGEPPEPRFSWLLRAHRRWHRESG